MADKVAVVGLSARKKRFVLHKGPLTLPAVQEFLASFLGGTVKGASKYDVRWVASMARADCVHLLQELPAFITEEGAAKQAPKTEL